MVKGFYAGEKVHWCDPAIWDYPEEEREMVINRVFIIDRFLDDEKEGAFIYEVDGPTEAEVPVSELRHLVVPAPMDGMTCLEPWEWDFISDDGSIAQGYTTSLGIRHCAMYVGKVLVEFSWKPFDNIVILSGQAREVVEKFNTECADGEVFANALSDKTIQLLMK